ncbi:Putative thiazole biosynthetic enzyme [uncultured archaeon]|nr:Putative thiazole biosynthetic enzyme [uncultured archaeon]
MKHHYAIAGAGPAGLAAASALADAGAKVTIYEKSAGSRFSGCYQIIENYRQNEDARDFLRRMGFTTPSFFIPNHEMTFHTPGGQVKTKSKKPYAYFIKRGMEEDAFDRSLMQQAQEKGVRILFNHPSPKEVDIAATGPYGAEGFSMEAVFDTDQKDGYHTLFNPAIAPGGYGYLFIIKGKATLGCAVTTGRKNLPHYYKCVWDYFRENIKFNHQKRIVTTNFMNFYLPKTAQLNGVLYAGEAAGIQDYTFGIGIRKAMLSGHLAAKSLIEKSDYDTLWKKEIQPGMESDLVNRYLIEKFGSILWRTLPRTLTNKDLREFGFYLHNPQNVKRLLLPWVKWRWKSKTPRYDPQRTEWSRKKVE